MQKDETEYTCCDCGAKRIRPFQNGDGKDRCEKCAVNYYYRNVGKLLFINQDRSTIDERGARYTQDETRRILNREMHHF